MEYYVLEQMESMMVPTGSPSPSSPFPCLLRSSSLASDDAADDDDHDGRGCRPWNDSLRIPMRSAAQPDGGGGGEDGGERGRTYNLAALFLFVIVVMAIGGNVLVCLAVYCKRKLQSMFNYFLVSLALSDMLSGALVMPLSIIRLATVDLLPVPKLVCVGWYSLDVLLTSSTICHLCMISIDRYMTLTYPLKYGHGKKKKHTLWKIAVVWVISFCIAGPLFILSMQDTHQDTVQYKGCGPETPTFVISATVTSFYLPLLIMTIMYALTVRALQRQLREQRRLTVTNSTRSSASVQAPTPTRSKANGQNVAPLAIDGGGGTASAAQRPYGGCVLAQRSPLYKQRTLPGCSLSTPLTPAVPSSSSSSYALEHHPLCKSTHSQSLKYRSVHTHGTRVTKQLSDSGVGSAAAAAASQGRYLLVAESAPLHATGSLTGSDLALQDDMDYDATGSQNNLGSPRSTVDRTRFRFNRSFTFRRSLSSTGSSRKGASSPEKSRRAVQVLGILFAVFVICYLPFFAVYLVKGTCLRCQSYISPHVLVALEWLAYSGSMLNPIIYHIFNPDFRRAFQTLLTCRCSSMSSDARHRRSQLPLCRIDTV